MNTKSMIILAVLHLLIISGCKKKEDPVDPYNYASATIKGAKVSFKTKHSFGRFCLTSGTCNTFYVNPDNILQHYIMIGLPKSPKVGTTYTNDSSKTVLLYTDASGKQYFSSWTDTLRITITRWDQSSGIANGTFSGKLRYSPDEPPYIYDSVYVENGTFSAPIWSVIP